MSNVNKTYQQGLIDGIQLYGDACGSQGDCSNCPISVIRGANVTCQEFAKQFPAKMLSLMTEMQQGSISYYQEYCMRFPNCDVDVETLSQCACRKLIFEGNVDCESMSAERCLDCWNATYTGDIEE